MRNFPQRHKGHRVFFGALGGLYGRRDGRPICHFQRTCPTFCGKSTTQGDKNSVMVSEVEPWRFIF